MVRWLRDPVPGFFALGALLFAVFAMLNREQAMPVILSDSGKAVLVSEWEMLTGRSASESDLRQIVEDYYAREVLFREGLRRELYQSDPSVRELIIELMQQQVTGEVAEPSGKDLVNFYSDNIDRYYSEATISFEQRVFFSAPQNPEALLKDLEEGRAEAGDVPWQGKSFPDYGASMVRGLFGQPLLAVLEQLPLNTWQGPYESRDGWHYFRVASRRPPVLLSFERVEDQLKADYQTAAVSGAVAAFVDTRRAHYTLKTAP
ncbi:MAG: peptidylprolyl isomerase [Congregibacter sp.]|nr:peptidylprolyl isomerase [Congregibacter sp.]